MSYRDFTLNAVKKQFGLTTHEIPNLWSSVPDHPPSDLLKAILSENVPLALAINTEKARSEMIVSPVLIEVRKLCHRSLSLFSGKEFDVDKEKGLTGICDFLLSYSTEQLFIAAPVATIVEAKNDNVKEGIGQCVATLIAAQLFNQREGNAIPTLCGVVTTGSNWMFMKLEEQVVSIDLTEYFISDMAKILGIFGQLLMENG
jgi:hypothetical protein